MSQSPEDHHEIDLLPPATSRKYGRCKVCGGFVRKCIDCREWFHLKDLNNGFCGSCVPKKSKSEPAPSPPPPEPEPPPPPPPKPKPKKKPATTEPHVPKGSLVGIKWKDWALRQIRRIAYHTVEGNYLDIDCPRCNKPKLERKKGKVQCENCRWWIEVVFRR